MELLTVLAAVILLIVVTTFYVVIGRMNRDIGHTKVGIPDEVFQEAMLETSDLFLNKNSRGICLALEHSSAPYVAKRLISRAIMFELNGHMFLSGWLVKQYGTDVDKDTVRAIRIYWLRESIRLGGIAHLHDIMRVHFPHMKRKTKK